MAQTRWQYLRFIGTRTTGRPFCPLCFLILIRRFATLEGVKIKSVTPMHHLMIMGSPPLRLTMD
jgi:hypothetical protein